MRGKDMCKKNCVASFDCNWANKTEAKMCTLLRDRSYTQRLLQMMVGMASAVSACKHTPKHPPSQTWKKLQVALADILSEITLF